MKIKIKNFNIESSLGINLYDLTKEFEVQQGKRIGQIDMRNVAYGVSLNRCFRIVLDDLTEEQLPQYITTFTQYLETYEKVNEQLKLEIQRLEVSLNSK